jgi:hypothetical protein
MNSPLETNIPALRADSGRQAAATVEKKHNREPARDWKSGATVGNVARVDASETSRHRWPNEYRDGARCAFLQRHDGKREGGGYPLAFHGWPLDRRNAWFAGFNVGFHDRLRLLQERR